jgi:hypothetical protein
MSVLMMREGKRGEVDGRRCGRESENEEKKNATQTNRGYGGCWSAG